MMCQGQIVLCRGRQVKNGLFVFSSDVGITLINRIDIMKIFCFSFFALGLLFGINTISHSQEVKALQDGSISMQMGVDGVVIEYEPTGEWRRVYARHEQDVSIPDARGVRTAKTIAEEKAKAKIVRFQNESMESGRVISEVEANIGLAVNQSDDTVSQYFSQNTRQVLTSLEEMTQSYARGELRGVIKIGDGYDADARLVWVEVGISRKSISAATSIGKAISENGNNVPDSSIGTTSHNKSSTQHPKSHGRKTEQEDW